jgi:transcriptional regulator with XRE-family HTH domain
MKTLVCTLIDLMYISKLKRERIRRGWSQQTLGFHAGVGASEISRFEHGRAIPYRGQAERLAKVLELRTEELLEPATTADEVVG